ncbi:putative phage tail protein [Pseudomonas sp. JUb42]|uniref:tail assembly protein n=1 Tax=Pseudomonas sp. JUb42 TaxID=2940611 RepID=UPI0021682AA2|nr:tail assembly protein [Pseudomonas sp. JUb42]MCS3467388.1 putative phage tail protein [Pseudomonas sp. JUb42]
MAAYVSDFPPVVEVRLYGVLGTRFGRVHRLAVRSGAEAVHALCVMVPGFRRFLRLSEERGLVFAVFRGKRNLPEEELSMRCDSNEPIRIAPIVVGSKSGGLFAAIAGVVLMVVGAYTGQFQLMAAGAGLLLGGVATMMSPSPGSLLNKEEEGNKPSYAFGGAVTTTAQGRCKPLLYGERDIGGAIGSAGIYAEDQQ